MRRFPLLRQVLEAYGVDRERVRLEWVSASEGQRFADIVADMTERVRALGPSRVRTALQADLVER
jgi:F420-non-reducing hydrogenase iron-sulfur subunit